MEGQDRTAKAAKHSQPTVPVQQEFLFVEASEAKASRQGRRNARSFVMQKARRERPWSTSKQAAKQRARENANPQLAGLPKILSTDNTAPPSPTSGSGGNGYFPTSERTRASIFEGGTCPKCKIFVVRHGQPFCPKCISHTTSDCMRQPKSGILDPFGASALQLDSNMSELLDHCKFVFRV